MPVPVVDLSSNANENMHHAATVLGKSRDRRLVFDAIYTGKRRIKSVAQISKSTGLTPKRVLEEGRRLAVDQIVNQVKHDGKVAYEKIDFFHHHKKRIRALAESKDKLAALETKRNPRSKPGSTITVQLSRATSKTELITVDDVSSFRAAWDIDTNADLPASVSEARFKRGIQRVLGEPGEFNDWGGEPNDLFTTRVRLRARRVSAAFAFKGHGTKGKLTPAKLGKNGDQIQRLFEAPAQVFFIQYHGQIAQSVLQQMAMLAVAKSVMSGLPIWYGIFDGQDSNRIYTAYRSLFT
jgi:hypothetical protein